MRNTAHHPIVLPGYGRLVGALKQTTQHGTEVFYYREGKGPRQRILGRDGQKLHPEKQPHLFLEAYKTLRLHYGRAPVAVEKPLAKTDKASLGWLIDQYLASDTFRDTLAPTSQKNRRNHLLGIQSKNGHIPFAKIDQGNVECMRDEIAQRGAKTQATVVLKSLRACFDWAVKDAKLLARNPAAGVEAAKRTGPKSDGFHQWTEGEIERYRAVFPHGTLERLVLEVLLWTGARRTDVVTLGDQLITHKGKLSFVPQKTARKTGKRVTIPVMPELKEALAKGPRGDMIWIACDGKPMTPDYLGKFLKRACRKALGHGTKCSAHGLRKACAVRFAERGATLEQLKAWFGWTENATPAIYTRGADNEKLAEGAALLMAA